MTEESNDEQQLRITLQEFYDNAWGQQWPRRRCTISVADLTSTPQPSSSAMEVDTAHCDDGILVYDSLLHMANVWNTLGAPDTACADVLVVLKEYTLLRKILKKGYLANESAIVLTGHPGIGKTTFLLYLLLHRLKKRRPTAVQLDAHQYFIFDEHGATVHPTHDLPDRLRACWALADSNDRPCDPFLIHPERVIQVSSGHPKNWKEWIKQKMGSCIISDLPTALEIGAIVKERGLDASSTLPLVRKWGPSTATIISIISGGARAEKALFTRVDKAAQDLSADPSFIMPNVLHNSSAADLVFCRPHRPKDPEGRIWDSAGTMPFIPTAYLRAIMEHHSIEMSALQSRQLFETFCSHSYTRTDDGWTFEETMHDSLSRGGPPVRIFRDEVKEHMPLPSRVLPGTLAGLESAKTPDPFYWMPSVVEFPGIDAVLGDNVGNIYVLQAAIPQDYCSPRDSLWELWRTLRLHPTRSWNFVVVAPSRKLARQLVTQFSEDLEGFTGPGVTVWGCVMRNM